MTVMRYSIAVDRLRGIAETSTRLASLSEDDPLVVGAYVGIDSIRASGTRGPLWPVWNHRIRGPVRFWSLARPDEPTLPALGERRFGDLHRSSPPPPRWPSKSKPS
jgi:hypothetical protein